MSKATTTDMKATPAVEEPPASSMKRKLILVLLVLTIVMVAANIIGEVRQMALPADDDSRRTTRKAQDSSAQTTITTTLDQEGLERRVVQAKEVMEQLEATNVLTTAFSNRSTVLRAGFPRVWNPCVLEAVVQRKQRVHVSFLGGSTCSRPGDNCPFAHQMDGRYSGLLEQKLQTLGAGYSVKNNCQGGTCSLAACLLLDGLIDPLETDVIVWDFLANDDAFGGGNPEQARKNDFFFTRVQSLYATVNKPPPAIVVMYLWQNRVQNIIPNQWNLDRHPMTWARPVIDSYKKLGWNIATLNIGATINAWSLRGENRSALLLDDVTHPSCDGNNLIADMLYHLIVNNTAHCTLDILTNQTTADNSLLPVPLPHTATWAETGTPSKELWNDLFNHKAKMGSISAWQPQVANRTTALTMDSDNLRRFDTWPTQLHDKAAPGRFDRKYGWLIPKCSEDKMEFTIQEPDLAWIGLSLGGSPVHPNMTINGKPVTTLNQPVRGWNFGVTRISNWIPMTKEFRAAPHGAYEISFCDPHKDPRRKVLDFFLGVSVPGKNQTGAMLMSASS